jgi:hypothetical protein
MNLERAKSSSFKADGVVTALARYGLTAEGEPYIGISLAVLFS